MRLTQQCSTAEPKWTPPETTVKLGGPWNRGYLLVPDKMAGHVLPCSLYQKINSLEDEVKH